MLNKIKKMFKDPANIIFALGIRGFLNWIPDSLFVRILFRLKLGYSLDLKNPKTFNEKLQWLKLYGGLEKYTDLVDKYEVRKFIAERIGKEYLIPLLGVWNKVENIDFEKLPDQFVLKCNHDCGSVVICKDKYNFNFKQAKKKLSKCLKRNFYYAGREPQYINIKPKIIAEQYLTEKVGMELKDYKFFCFNGEPKYIQVDFDRFTEHKRNIYDASWSFLNFEILYPSDKNRLIPKPQKLDEMPELARKLSAGIPHVRIDFYYVENKVLSPKVLFGEITFSHEAGFGTFKPLEWDRVFGDCIELPKEII